MTAKERRPQAVRSIAQRAAQEIGGDRSSSFLSRFTPLKRHIRRDEEFSRNATQCAQCIRYGLNLRFRQLCIEWNGVIFSGSFLRVWHRLVSVMKFCFQVMKLYVS